MRALDLSLDCGNHHRLTGKVMYGSVISKPSLAVHCKCKPTSAIFSSQFVRKVNSLSTRVTGDIKTSCGAI